MNSTTSQSGPHRDPLREIYKGSIGEENPAHHWMLARHQTALLCIDMQYLDAARGHGIFRDATSSGVPLEDQEYYFSTLEERVIPRMRRLQDAFRRAELEVIHVRIQALTADGRDRSKGHKRLGVLAGPGTREADFLEAVGPQGDEIIINKTASGVFSATNLNFVLKNLGITAVYVAGVYTNECVETTIRDACDLGFLVTMIDDCCTTVTPELQRASIAVLRDRYARILSSVDAIEEIDSIEKERLAAG